MERYGGKKDAKLSIRELNNSAFNMFFKKNCKRQKIKRPVGNKTTTIIGSESIMLYTGIQCKQVENAVDFTPSIPLLVIFNKCLVDADSHRQKAQNKCMSQITLGLFFSN